MSRDAIAWGFIGAGFLMPAVGIIVGAEAGMATGLACAALWCCIIALAKYVPSETNE